MNQNFKPTEVQGAEDDKIPDAQDAKNTPIQGNDTNPQSDNENNTSDILDEKTS